MTISQKPATQAEFAVVQHATHLGTRHDPPVDPFTISIATRLFVEDKDDLWFSLLISNNRHLGSKVCTVFQGGRRSSKDSNPKNATEIHDVKRHRFA
jgi:hypothetical protein